MVSSYTLVTGQSQQSDSWSNNLLMIILDVSDASVAPELAALPGLSDRSRGLVIDNFPGNDPLLQGAVAQLVGQLIRVINIPKTEISHLTFND